MPLIINSKLTLKDLIRVNFQLLIRHLGVLYFYIFICLPMLTLVLYDFPNSINFNNLNLYFAVTGFIIMPILFFITTRNSYYSNVRFHQDIRHTINDDSITLGGESFTAIIPFDKIYKIVELKNGFIVFQRHEIFVILLKRFFTQEEDIEAFRNLMNRINSPNQTILTYFKGRFFYSVAFFVCLTALCFALASSMQQKSPLLYVMTGSLFIILIIIIISSIPSFLLALVFYRKPTYKERFVKVFLWVILIFSFFIFLLSIFGFMQG